MYEKETNLVESNFCFVTNGALSWLVAHIFFAVNGVKCAFDEKSSFKNIIKNTFLNMIPPKNLNMPNMQTVCPYATDYIGRT